MKTNQFFQSEAEAQAFASVNGGTITRLENTAFLLPAGFWAQLKTSPAAFAVAIRAHADGQCGGCLKSAWSDALDGQIRGVPARAMSDLDAQFRAPVVSVRWMVTFDDGVIPVQVGSFSRDAGEAGNEDAAWGSSSNDGWRVD